MIRKALLLLLLFLTACSTNSVSPASATTHPAASSPETPVTSTAPAQGDKAYLEGYYLQAEFHWVDTKTRTDINYGYQAAFLVFDDGQLKAPGDQPGLGDGVAGIRVDDCVEVQPVNIEFSYEFQGRKTDASIDDVDTLILMSDPDLVDDGQITVFDLSFANPIISNFELEPFTTCIEEMDMELAQSSLTFWLQLIPDLPSQYRLIPAQSGTYCLEPISYIEEGLGVLTPCYTISKAE